MANSTSANLKLTVQATGENSGTWGQITNTNLLILEQAIGGYDTVALNETTGATLTFTNGALSNGKNQVIKLTGTITTNVNVVVPDSIEKTYIVENGTTGAHTVTIKTTSGTGVTFAADDKGTKMVYSDGTNVVDTAFTDLSSDKSPQLAADLDANGNNILIDSGNSINDENDLEQIKFSTTASAINELTVKNAAAGNAPEVSSTGDDTNIDLKITPKGSGNVVLDGLKYPNADGSADEFLKTDGSGNLSFAAAGGGLQSIQVFTSSGTYTKPAGINKIKVYVTGGGGGGGGCPNAEINRKGGGGGGGGTAIEILDASSITTETVTIGAGGSGSGGDGGGGGTSSFGSFCTGEGGSGGDAAGSLTAPGQGSGGSGIGGTYNLRGQAGEGADNSDSPGNIQGGSGGSSFFGGGGTGVVGNSAQAGSNGGGGGGTSSNQPPTIRGGGSGGDGIVVVEEYA
jgi:hypothetical protein